MPQRSQWRRWLVALAEILVLVVALVSGMLTNVLSEFMPAIFKAQAEFYFLYAVVASVLIAFALLILRPQTISTRISRNRQRLLSALQVFQAFAIAVASIFGNLAATTLPDSPLLLTLGVFAVLLSMFTPLAFEAFTLRSKRARTDYTRFLHQLIRRYEMYLDDPLQHEVRAALGLVDTPFALSPLVTSSSHVSEQIEQGYGKQSGMASVNTLAFQLPPGTTLLNEFDKAGGHLLILGEPGAGKTTQMFELGYALAVRASSATQVLGPLPIILDLTAWATNKDSLGQWLIDEITLAYDVHRAAAAHWVETEQIALLLDALDVMTTSDGGMCVEAINAYHTEHPLVQIVVCSRREEYQQLGTKFRLQCAVTLEPLTDEAINDALASGHERQAALRAVVASDAQLRDILRTPLILSLVVLTYGRLVERGGTVPPVTDVPAWQNQLFSRFVETSLRHHKDVDQEQWYEPGTAPRVIHYDAETFKDTLAWLGYELRDHRWNTLYLEQLQADWIPDPTARRRYVRLSQLISGLGGGLIVGLVWGFVWGVVWGPLSGLVGGLVGGLLWGLAEASESNVPIVRLRWSWAGFRAQLRFGLVFGLVFGLIFGLLRGLLTNELRAGWIHISGPFVGLGVGLLSGVLAGFAVGIVGGLQPRRIKEQDFVKPNQGIWRSGQTGLVAMGIIVLTVVPVGGLVFGPVGGFGGGLLAGLGGGLVLGGRAALQHVMLRLTLQEYRVTPPYLVRFFDEASQLVLLRRFGGGYQFIHQVLRDYFADQYTSHGGGRTGS